MDVARLRNLRWRHYYGLSGCQGGLTIISMVLINERRKQEESDESDVIEE